MPSYAAYNEDLPCKNPNCSSHGRPHPNCKCYFGGEERRAEGGEIESFCSRQRAHDPECEYFAEGGMASQGIAPAQTGTNFLNLILQSGLARGDDEVGNALGHESEGDQSGAIASMIAHLGAGGILDNGKASSKNKEKLKEIQKEKLKNNSIQFLEGLGANHHGISLGGNQHAKAGSNAHDQALNMPFDQDVMHSGIEKLLGRSISSKSKKFIIPAVMKVLSSGNLDDLHEGIEHAENVSSGSHKIDQSIEDLFDSKMSPEESDPVSREKLKKYVEENILHQEAEQQLKNDRGEQQMFAEGGMAEAMPSTLSNKVDVLSRHWPAQAMVLGASKARINNFLNSERPLPNVDRLPYDNKQEDHHKKKEYDKILDLANQPLRVLNHIKDGTIDPKVLGAFSSMYPELHDHLNKKITARVMKDHLEDKKPSYHLRQGLSYFLGSPLDSTLKQPNMAAAQSVFMPMQAPPSPQGGAPGKKKKNTAPLSKLSDQYQTTDQAAEARQRNS